jgi:hypothetical protein
MLIGDGLTAVFYLCDFLCALSFGRAAHSNTSGRKYASTHVGRSVMRQADHRYGFLINYRSEGSRRLLSDVPAKVPAKYSKMNSFCYNPGINTSFLISQIVDWLDDGVNTETAIYGYQHVISTLLTFRFSLSRDCIRDNSVLLKACALSEQRGHQQSTVRKNLGFKKWQRKSITPRH